MKGTLSLIKTDKKLKFGGYTQAEWNHKDNYYLKDKEAFVFSLNFNLIFEPFRAEKAIQPNIKNGPNFGKTVFGVWDDAFRLGGYTNMDRDFNYMRCEIMKEKKCLI